MLGYRKIKVKGGEWEGGKKLEAESPGKRLLQLSSHKERRVGLSERDVTNSPVTSQGRCSHFPQDAPNVA